MKYLHAIDERLVAQIDYKLEGKPLPSAHRADQAAYFGKRGISVLGVKITSRLERPLQKVDGSRPDINENNCTLNKTE
jgi:hypothetical protein